MDAFFAFVEEKGVRKIDVAVMDMWKAFRSSTRRNAPQAAILFDKFHILTHLGEALDQVRKQEYARLTGGDRKFIKGQKYALLSHRENLTTEARAGLKALLAANRRLNTAYILKESFSQLWDDGWIAQTSAQIMAFNQPFRKILGLHYIAFSHLPVAKRNLPGSQSAKNLFFAVS